MSATALVADEANAASSIWDDPEPIRGDLVGGDRLVALADAIAAEHASAYGPAQSRVPRRQLAPRAEDNARRLMRAYRVIAGVGAASIPLSPAAEWLNDNFHLVERQLRQIRDDLPRGFDRQLPRLASGPFEGYPRILSVAWALVAHTDSRIDAVDVASFTLRYQKRVPLRIGELWALATVLRIVLIENLRRCADRVVDGRQKREQADRIADAVLDPRDRANDPISTLVRACGDAPVPQTFAVRLLQRLRDQGPAVLPALHWLEQRLAEQGRSIEGIVHDEHQRQAAANVTVRNIITSLRQLATLDWTTVVERVSLVDERLRSTADFAQMDFATRTRYRDAVEELARGSERTELSVVDAALARAARPRGALDGAADAAPAQVGYHLIGPGRPQFERELGYRPQRRDLIRRALRAGGLAGYLSFVGLLMAIEVCAAVLLLQPSSAATSVAFALIVLLPALESAVLLANTFYTAILKPQTLPRLEFKGVVPAGCRTLLVMPILLNAIEDVAERAERLEAHYLASARGELYFALLTDYADAPSERVPEDDAVRASAAKAIEQLNARYDGGVAGPRFRLLHRRRQWSEDQVRWIGWERKRGKLHELNRWLRSATDTSFDDRSPPPAGVRYVITLDADTELPPGAAERLIGKLAHPLNRARFDAEVGRVVAGFGILQPRVTPALSAESEGSIFHEAWTGTRGLDPYVFAVSDLYQDLCGEGSYSGKGIYDVDAFESALEGRVPENAVLSHDLFEGVFARAGFASDVEVVEPFPDRYDVSAARQHRWARGDWQLAPYLYRTAGPAGAAGRRARVPGLGRWKMLDNLRRTLQAPALVLALLAAAALPGRAGAFWVASLLAIPALPRLLGAVLATAAAGRTRNRLSVDDALVAEWRGALLQGWLAIVLLADQACVMLDAICRALYRVVFSRRHLLDWTTAAQVALAGRSDVRAYLRRMSGGVAIAAAGLLWLGWQGTAAAALLTPVVLFWILAPVIACWASRPRAIAQAAALGRREAAELRLIARQSFAYFERFVTPASHHLPPDNFQETPAPALAQRTSPTNVGLYLLSLATARSLGWIGLLDTIDAVEATLGTVEHLEKMRGHLYNWYDTGSLEPLEPRYVSTVDSGNLAGHLIALAQFCERASAASPLSAESLRGLADTCLLAERLAAASTDSGPLGGGGGPVRPFVERIAGLCTAEDPTAADVVRVLSAAAAIAREAGAVAGGGGPDGPTVAYDWSVAVLRCALSHGRDLGIVPGDSGTGVNPALRPRLEALAARARRLAFDMEFGFLFDPVRALMSIGYAVRENRCDGSYYDLLASEARLASFVAIAKGDVPTRHWFRLGRAMTRIGRTGALLSWSGSMFEYLMPALVMQAPVGSLLERTQRAVVARQQAYARERGTPWGISESAYNVRDVGFTYQYSDFGVPGLGLKPGLDKYTVIAPYATALATAVDPMGAAQNLARLASLGALGTFGFFEALDFTPDHLPQGASVATVRAYMAHHQGMTVTGIGESLLRGFLRSCFHSEPRVRAAELLLQERPPLFITPPVHQALSPPQSSVRQAAVPRVRRFTSWQAPAPITQIIGNGRYTVMLTTAGSGYSRCGPFDVSRWRDDVTCEADGYFIYVRDVESGRLWSSGYQPTQAEPDSYSVTLSEDRCEIQRRDGNIATTTEYLVSVEHDAEIRRLSITNHGSRSRTLELTSYAELVLVPSEADQAHPAFAKMFVQTEYLVDEELLVARRRARAQGEEDVWAGHLVEVEGTTLGATEFDTDRARFLGRGRTAANALAMSGAASLSGRAGTVLDPIFALRRRVRVLPGETVRAVFWTLVGRSREELIEVAKRCRGAGAVARAATLAWTYAQVQLHHVGIDADEANLFQRLSAYILYANNTLRPRRSVDRNVRAGAAALWAHGISGDLPIVLVRIDAAEDLGVVRQLLRAHEYWDSKNLSVDVVIVNDISLSYAQGLQGELEALVRAGQVRTRAMNGGRLGNVYALRSNMLDPQALQSLQVAARIEIHCSRGTLAEQLQRLDEQRPAPRRRAPPVTPLRSAARLAPPTGELEFFNGLGGFSENGREYVTVLPPTELTPAPWINVVANPSFGFHASVEGGGYTWSENSRENALTPWANDPVTDRSGEVLYVRDEESGALWTATAAPIRDESAYYVAVHGQGYSRFLSTVQDVSMTLLQFVPLTDPVKISRLTLRNASARPRRLSVCAYAEWALGPARPAAAPFIETDRCPRTGALLARNPWNASFGERIAFLCISGQPVRWTCDRTEFLGRHGNLSAPAALRPGGTFSEACGNGLDPAAAIMTDVVVPPFGSSEVIVMLGQGRDAKDVEEIVNRYRLADVDPELARVMAHWQGVLGRIEVRTPDRAMDLMLNRWLLYQTRACRMWARSALYQSSGAYGFRDQLQDSMALAVADPATARQHLLRAAGRQFLEGDVQHWWMPESGRGVRTHISDDPTWLAYVTNHYVSTTDDRAVLDEIVPYLEGQALAPDAHDAYFQPTTSSESATLYEHCARALDFSLRLGPHGLPLIGTGDWNDGFDRVGAAGRGESVWLGWFLAATLTDFAMIAEARGDADRVTRWRQHVQALQGSLEQSGWDGDWYRRGFFDDGTPLGSQEAGECRIDCIAQSWAVISGAARPARAVHAMAAVQDHLIRRDLGLALLFAPPFVEGRPDPGYIRAYPAGIRENGGQYTHAASWSIVALAMLGEGDRAAELFAMLNPVGKATNREDVERYKVEPYVVAADVYSAPDRLGRGGWTWYTGAAGWLHRAGIESMLGIRLRGAVLLVDPCIPKEWRGFEVTVRYRTAVYQILVTNPFGLSRGLSHAELDDGSLLRAPLRIVLADDGSTHRVRVVMG